MTESDRAYWDRRWIEVGPAPRTDPAPPPPEFADLIERFPASGRALDLACGRGRATAWLAQRGLDVTGIDLSPVAVDLARVHAAAMGVARRCTFVVTDLTTGLPQTGPIDVIISHMYWLPQLAVAAARRLRPGGLLAVCQAADAGTPLLPGIEAVPGLTIEDSVVTPTVARVVARRQPIDR